MIGFFVLLIFHWSLFEFLFCLEILEWAMIGHFVLEYWNCFSLNQTSYLFVVCSQQERQSQSYYQVQTAIRLSLMFEFLWLHHGWKQVFMLLSWIEKVCLFLHPTEITVIKWLHVYGRNRVTEQHFFTYCCYCKDAVLKSPSTSLRRSTTMFGRLKTSSSQVCCLVF